MPKGDLDISGYSYSHAACGCAHQYILPALDKVIARLPLASKRVLDLGCGNGAVANWLASKGFDVTGVDPSETGIAEAKRAFPQLRFQIGTAYDDLKGELGTFPLVVSLEVVEHLYAPRKYAACIRDLLDFGGYALITTPYHGYIKNLMLALTGKMEAHFSPLWDHGHIKFWSPATITRLLVEADLQVLEIQRLGRIPPIAKSMLVVARRGE